MAYKDVEKQRAAWNRWYHRNKIKKAGWAAKQKAVVKGWIRKHKSELMCSRCPEAHPACLQFHHRDRSSKIFEIGNAVREGWGLAAVMAEIEKCSVLCANCHAKEHYAE